MENGPGLKMYSLLKMAIFHCHVGLPEGNRDPKIVVYEIIPISLGSISFPINPQPPGAFFHCSCDKTILGVVGFSSHS